MPTTFTITCGADVRTITPSFAPFVISAHTFEISPPIQMLGGTSCTLVQGDSPDNTRRDAFVVLFELKGTMQEAGPRPPPPPSPPPSPPG